MFLCNFKRSSSVVLLGFLLVAGSSAQSDRHGSVTGTVTSQTGSPLVGITVQLQNVADNSVKQTTADSSGKYRFDDIAPGNYRMTTTNQGVTSAPSNQVTVTPGEVTVINLSIGAPPAAPAQTPNPSGNPVTSAEASSAQELSGPRIGAEWNQRNVQYLPPANFLAPTGGPAYSAYNLSLFTAGVASDGGIGAGRGPVVGGERPDTNDFLVEGVDNNNRTNPGQLTYISNDAISEFFTQQNQFSPEYGHATGGQFNAVIRTGSNALHGEAYDYLQNQNLNSQDAVYARQGIPGIPRYDQNRVGGNIGFPIVRNKLFFFGDFEYIPLGFDAVPTSVVYAPTAAGYSMLAGIPGVSPTNLQYLQSALPAASTANTTTTVNGTQVPLGISPIMQRAYQNQYNGVAALDWKISGSDSLQARYVHNDLHASDGGAELPEFVTPFYLRAILASLSEVHTFGSGVINELRLSYHRDDSSTALTASSFPGLGFNQAPTISIQQDLNATLGPGLTGPQSTSLGTYSLADNIHWTMGHHSLRLGYDGRRYIGPVNFSQNSTGTYSYSNLQGYLLNLPPDVLGERVAGSTSIPTNQWDSYAYVKDDWRVSQNLNIDLGVRYEYVTVPAFENLQSLDAIANVPGVITFHRPQAQDTGFAPTVGLAYSPGTMQNSVFRAGFGMNYDTAPYASLLPLYASGLSSTLYTAGLPSAPGFFSPSNPFFNSSPITPFGPGLTPLEARAQTSSYFPNQQLPYTMQWNASWEQQFLRRFILQVRYLGVRGVHLPNTSLLNEISNVTPSNSLPVYYSAPSQAQLNGLTTTLASLAPTNPLAGYGFTNPILTANNSGNSLYNGLSVQGNQRFSGGFQVVAAYTWSHLIDDISTPFFAASPTWQLQEQPTVRASSEYDHRQRATVTGLWDLGALDPSGSGWSRAIVNNLIFSGTYVYETPAPLTLTSGLNTDLTGFTSGGVLVNPSGLPNTGSAVSPLTNSFGQTVAYLADNPNARYIAGAPGVYTNSGRSDFFGRPIFNFDASLAKGFGIRDRWKIEFRGDAFNLFNHAQYTPGELSNIGLPQSTTLNYLIPGTPQFASAQTVFPSHARVVQVSAKVVF
jgi:hypothetical protein